MVQRISVRHFAKCYADQSNSCWDMAIFGFFKTAAIRHPEFLKIPNFTCRYSLEGQWASLRQISYPLVKPQLRFDFSIFFQNGGHGLECSSSVRNTHYSRQDCCLWHDVLMLWFGRHTKQALHLPPDMLKDLWSFCALTTRSLWVISKYSFCVSSAEDNVWDRQK